MKFWQISKKDLKLLFRDRRALLTLLLLPLIFITIIGLTTGRLMGWSSANQMLKVAFADEVAYPTDNERQSKRDHNMVMKIFNNLQKRSGIVVQTAATAKEARRLYDKGDVELAVIIGPEFLERVNELSVGDLIDPNKGLQKGGLESIGVLVESTNPDSSSHSIAEGHVFFSTMGAISPRVFCANDFTRIRMRGTCEDLDAEVDQPPLAALPGDEQAGEGGYGVYEAVIPGFTVMFVFFLVNVMARSFITERDLGTLRRLRIAPLGAPSILSGKTVPFLIVSLMQTVLLFLCGKFLFNMSWGPEPWLLLPVVFSTSLAATALGLLVATLAKTESQVSSYANIVVIAMAGVSGCFMPRAWLPANMKTLSLAVPHSWSVMAYREILDDVGLPNHAIVYQSCAALIAFSLVYFAIGTLRFRQLD